MEPGQFADDFFFGKIVADEVAYFIGLPANFQSGGVIGDGRHSLERFSSAETDEELGLS